MFVVVRSLLGANTSACSASVAKRGGGVASDGAEHLQEKSGVGETGENREAGEGGEGGEVRCRTSARCRHQGQAVLGAKVQGL